MKDYQISLWNEACSPIKGPDIFGCSVHGLSFRRDWFDPEECSTASWGNKLTGQVLSGTYQSVLNSLKVLPFTPAVCIALFRQGAGIDSFLRLFSLTMRNIPVIGGAASFLSGKTAGDLSPDGEDLTLFAVANANFEFSTLNIYDHTGISVEVIRKTDREFEFLRILPDGKWENALNFYHRQQETRSVDINNFELITFADRNDRNMHFRSEGHSLASGADLPDDNILFLKVTSREKAEKMLAAFISDENSLVFGCAGIRSLLTNPYYPGNNSLLVFMYGEVFTLSRKPMFGNLMLARLTMK